ncbi:hypothetical protein GK047_02630 [Paenibacillus sp. SYP-B3998]|uniref:Uncharacterized protein n=1 Tax=Paenibacillus sp. SYP-B3998 TaxID=2678564 RepID=A0A6G3ZRT0_9BACL|nr:hypothetical protein [Paenibacillus sp. SYP-B3998]NEW04913.1 hypothetical protein [Paenibacillus sp. SYP-B3998]
MSVYHQNKENHLKMIYRNNVVIAKDGDRLIVVHSKRTIKPLLPFEITKEVFEQWNRRDSRIDITYTPYKELFDGIGGQRDLIIITNFDDIEFKEN